MPVSPLPLVIPASVLLGIVLVELAFDIGAEPKDAAAFYK
jgi:hypothetical protein